MKYVTLTKKEIYRIIELLKEDKKQYEVLQSAKLDNGDKLIFVADKIEKNMIKLFWANADNFKTPAHNNPSLSYVRDANPKNYI